MKKIIGLAAAIALLALLSSGIFSKILEFFAWLFLIQYAGPETSIFGEIIVRILTFAVSYGLVRIVFELLGCFNSKVKSIAYWVISSLLGFVLAYIIWSIEEHLLIIGIVLGIITVLVILFFVIRTVVSNKKKAKNYDPQE